MLLSSYALLSTAGYLIGAGVFSFYARKDGRPAREIIGLSAVAITASLFGAKIFHTLFEASGHNLPNGELAGGVFDLLSADPWHWARLFSPGHVFLGGFLFATTAVFLVLWFAKAERPLRYADYFAPAIAIGLSIGRLGCYFAGCCFGRPTNFQWLSVTYDGPLGELGPLLPVQLFESAFAFLCFIWLVFKASKPRSDGFLFLSFLLPYCSFRFIIEFFRADLERGLWSQLALSTSQIVCVLIISGAGLLYWLASDRKVGSKLG